MKSFCIKVIWNRANLVRSEYSNSPYPELEPKSHRLFIHTVIRLDFSARWAESLHGTEVILLACSAIAHIVNIY